MKTVKLICCNCGVEYLKYANWAKRDYEIKGYKNYCSKECAVKARIKEPLKLVCCGCNKIFFRKDDYKNKRTFCSKLCANKHNGKNNPIGLEHPCYVNGISSYRKIINESSKCYYCDYNNIKILVVHHIDKDRTNNNIENLLVVCPTHHIEIHKGIISPTRKPSADGTEPF
jgi:hypothetical protein